MNILDFLHENRIFPRRVGRLSQCLAKLIPANASVLDVGCGDGRLAEALQQLRPDLTLAGIDTLVRKETAIPISAYDGHSLQFADGSFDVVMFIDVLHHTLCIRELLREAVRVTRQFIVIKDHQSNGVLAAQTLRFMDWVGNRRYGVSLPFNYLSSQQWTDLFRECSLRMISSTTALALYPWPASFVFDRSLHLLVQVEPPAPAQ